MSLNNGISSLIPFELPNKKLINVACSKSHYIAIAADYSVYTWGEDNAGQLAQGNKAMYRKYPICVDFLHQKNIEKCAAGNQFSIFLTKSGLVLSCGEGKTGCLGHGDWNCVFRPKLIDTLITSVIIDIVCGSDHVLALTVDHKIFVWGLGEYGQLGLDNKKFCCYPINIKFDETFSVAKIYAGENTSAVISTNGNLMVCGSNKYNKLGFKDMDTINKFTKIHDIKDKVSEVALGKNHTMLLTADGNIIAMGRNAEGQLGKGNCKQYTLPQKIEMFNGNIKMIQCGPNFTIVTTKTNVLYFWGIHYIVPSENNESNAFQNYLREYLRSDLEQPVSKKSEVILKPKSILALYSSPENEKNNSFITMGKILAQDYGVVLLVHTSSRPPSPDNNKSSSNSIQNVPKNALTVSNPDTNLPNTPYSN